MRTLNTILEGIMDSDYGMDDDTLVSSHIFGKIIDNQDGNIELSISGTSLIIDGTGSVDIQRPEEITKVGLDSIVCKTGVTLYLGFYENPLSIQNLRIDAPKSEISCDFDGVITISNCSIKCHNLNINANDSDKGVIVFRKSNIECQALNSFATTSFRTTLGCKFNVSSILFGSVGGTFLKKCQSFSFFDFRTKIINREPTNEQIASLYSENPLSILGLKPNEWPVLSRIGILPKGRQKDVSGVCCVNYNKSQTFPGRTWVDPIEMKDGWYASAIQSMLDKFR